MWILHVRADHVGGRPSQRAMRLRRRGCKGTDEWKHLPLWGLQQYRGSHSADSQENLAATRSILHAHLRVHPTQRRRRCDCSRRSSEVSATRGGSAFRGRRDDPARSDELEDVHVECSESRLGFPANLLNGCHDIAVGPTTADVSTHQFLYIRVVGAAWLFEKGDRRHDLPGRAISTLVTIADQKRRLHGVQGFGCTE